MGQPSLPSILLLLVLLLLAAAADAWVRPTGPRHRWQPPYLRASSGSTLEGSPAAATAAAAGVGSGEGASVTTGVNVFYSEKLLEHKVGVLGCWHVASLPP